MRWFGRTAVVLLWSCCLASADPTNVFLADLPFPGSGWVDQVHSNMGANIDLTAVWLDSRFGGAIVVTDKTAACTAMVGAEVLMEKGGAVAVRARGRASFDLPRMEHRLRLFVDNFRHDMLPGADHVEGREELKIGTRWRISQTVRSLFDFDVGVRARLPPEPFARLRFDYGRKLGVWVFGFDQKEFWTVDDHLGELTAVTFTRPLWQRCLFRSVTAAKWSQESEGLESEQTFGVAVQYCGGRRQLDFSGSMFAERNDLVNYRLSVGWRARWLRTWNTVYVIPEVQFPGDEDFRAHPALRIGIETIY